MKYTIIVIAGLMLSLGLSGCASEQYVQNHRNIPTQADTLRMMKIPDVIALSKSGVSDSLIIATMDATDSWFKLSAQDVIELKNAGVSEKVINAMMQQPAESTVQANDTRTVRYLVYSPYWWWYDGFYPYSYYPSFSVRFGHPFYHHHGFAFHRRFH